MRSTQLKKLTVVFGSNAGECCEATLALTGASYSRPSRKRDAMHRKTPDSYVWVDADQSYYISMVNETKASAIESMRLLKDFQNLGAFMKTHAEVVKNETKNIAGQRYRSV
jgi:hypothetical protein